MARAISGLVPAFRVVAAHQALQLGELADHARHEVGLGELRRAAPRILAPRPTEPAIWKASSAMRSTRSFCEPSFSWKVMPRARAHLVERPLEVLLPEELGVRQPRGDHLLVAGDDLLAAVLGDQVRDQQESVGELPVPGPRARSTSGAASSTSSGIRPAPPGTPRRTGPSAPSAIR